MKKIKWMPLLFAAVCGLLFAFSACGEDNADAGKLNGTDSSKTLVAYFSATGTTKGVAEKIAEATDGTLFEITPAEPYTATDLNYGSASSRTSAEDNDPNARPEIGKTLSDMEGYDVIYLGYPIWFGKAPKIIYTFLETYDFSGKTIVPFCTSGSSGIEGSLSELKALTPAAAWLSGKRFSASASQNDIQEWINGLNG